MRRAGMVLLVVASVTCAVLAVPAAQPHALAQTGGMTLAIDAAASVDAGTVAVGTTTKTVSFGAVKVTAGPTGVLGGSWTASVSTSGLATGGGAAHERIPGASMSYLSGLVTTSSGLSLGLCTPGQALVAVDLSVPRTAFRCSSFTSLTTTSVTWTPQLTLRFDVTNPAGVYTGTVTHSVV